MSNKQKEVTEFGLNYTKAWNSQKPEQVAEFFSQDGSLIVNNGVPNKGRDQITAFVKGFMNAFPDMKLTMDSLKFNSNDTEYHWRFIGTNTGTNGTGNKVDFSGFERWTFDDDGLIKQSIGSFDEADYRRQVNINR